ncbi:MAG TPA: electron transporter RnfB, partial [Firmicutes bacterium]|nr:electron transporter RnfB [Bacillota bacterium]
QPKVAKVLCQGDSERAISKYNYSGIGDCVAAAMLSEGPKGCRYGCMGLGSCVKACPFDAIHVNEKGIAFVDEEKCTGCGLCVKACPRHLITLWPVDKSVTVLCMNQDKGVEVRKVCKVGCIGCRICEKQCPTQAITVENNLARIDPQLCTECGICVTKCPMKTIKGEKKQEREVV